MDKQPHGCKLPMAADVLHKKPFQSRHPTMCTPRLDLFRSIRLQALPRGFSGHFISRAGTYTTTLHMHGRRRASAPRARQLVTAPSECIQSSERLCSSTLVVKLSAFAPKTRSRASSTPLLPRCPAPPWGAASSSRSGVIGMTEDTRVADTVVRLDRVERKQSGSKMMQCVGVGVARSRTEVVNRTPIVASACMHPALIVYCFATHHSFSLSRSVINSVICIGCSSCRAYVMAPPPLTQGCINNACYSSTYVVYSTNQANVNGHINGQPQGRHSPFIIRYKTRRPYMYMISLSAFRSSHT